MDILRIVLSYLRGYGNKRVRDILSVSKKIQDLIIHLFIESTFKIWNIIEYTRKNSNLNKMYLAVGSLSNLNNSKI